MFGILPASAFFLRHARGIQMDHIDICFAREDTPPAIVIEDVNGLELDHVQVAKPPGALNKRMKDVRGLVTHDSSVAPDGCIDQIEAREFK